ncbi:MAG TPA: NAD-dependent succinate-semialdehyde dehydrogenase [Ohtaekwangia sp.]|uniref:NAD-dependent succinate-semialdehyde dehydrogenase n=1 Tax=Ohtaekwangia sp. TaxID=2066019 RepID=UPI002F922286
MLKSIHPFDQSVIEEFPLHTVHDIRAKLDKAALAFSLWKKTTVKQRSEMLLHVAAVLRKNKEEYARIITWEMGKVISEARAEVEKCAVGCEYYAHNAENFLADRMVKTEAKRSFVAYQPIGAILAIMPWNFPFWQVFRYAAPALTAGNVGLLKHASNVTKCSTTIEKIFHEAGYPDGVFQSLIIESSSVEQILESPIVQGVALTGSEIAGSKVGAIAGKNIKKSVLELGGSDPFIVLDDADLDLTVKIATQSRMQNAGQSCIAAKRFIVLDAIKDEFIDRFKKSIEALKQGNPFDEQVTTGPLARVDLADDLDKQLQNSLKHGAQLVTGGKKSGANFQPTLLSRVKPGIQAFDEETFGPLAAVISADTDQEAIALANASRYGLGASVWTKDIERGERLAREIESGSVFVNSLMRSDARLPFGGVKKSGYGRELHEHGIHEFVNIKTIFVA